MWCFDWRPWSTWRHLPLHWHHWLNCSAKSVTWWLRTLYKNKSSKPYIPSNRSEGHLFYSVRFRSFFRSVFADVKMYSSAVPNTVTKRLQWLEEFRTEKLFHFVAKTKRITSRCVASCRLFPNNSELAVKTLFYLQCNQALEEGDLASAVLAAKKAITSSGGWVVCSTTMPCPLMWHHSHLGDWLDPH